MRTSLEKPTQELTLEEVEAKLQELRKLYKHPPEGRSRSGIRLEARPLEVLRDILKKRRPSRSTIVATQLEL